MNPQISNLHGHRFSPSTGVLITGASRGIGAALASAFSAAGATVGINYHKGEAEAQAVLESILAEGGQAVLLPADVAQAQGHDTLLDAFEAATGCAVHVLINNAAIECRQPLLEIDESNLDQTMNINLRGPFFLAQAVAKRMISGKIHGRIINISSTHAERAKPNSIAYSISKAGLNMMTKGMALELGAHGITVNSLVPGAIRTDLNREVLSDLEYERGVVAKIPLGRIAETGELIEATLFLAGEGGAYVTGSSLTVDGGLAL
jgi:glucose 1-dehydrogenase